MDLVGSVLVLSVFGVVVSNVRKKTFFSIDVFPKTYQISVVDTGSQVGE